MACTTPADVETYKNDPLGAMTRGRGLHETPTVATIATAAVSTTETLLEL